MAKGSESVRSRKPRAAKPYDVSNSFVKKVTSQVSNLLQQPAWLSKWFSSSTTNDAHQQEAEAESDDDDDVEVVQPPPIKGAKISLNQQFPANSFHITLPGEGSRETNIQAEARTLACPKAEPRNLSRSSPRAQVESRSPIRNTFPEAVAGPSGLNSSSRLVTSTTFHTESLEGKLNGDGGSDSSESTSGCSSLVPQAVRQIQSETLATRRRIIDEKLQSTSHLQSPRSLFPNTARTPQLNLSVGRRRSSFNVSTFGSPLLDAEKLPSKEVSPFYAGRTIYGGASAYRRPRDVDVANELNLSKRGVQVRPLNDRKDSPDVTMSHTARRILEALEQFSTPVQDARRMPLGSTYKPPLAFKRRCLSMDDAGSSRNPKPSATPLIVPTVPDLLKLRHRQKLQDTMESARQMASTASQTEPYSLRFDDDSRGSKHQGKVTKAKPLDEEVVKEVNLPNIPLPITSLPKFDFMVPAVSNTTLAQSGNYKFSPPVIVSSDLKNVPSRGKYSFRLPLNGRTDEVGISSHLKKDDSLHKGTPSKSKEQGDLPKHKSDNGSLKEKKGEGGTTAPFSGFGNSFKPPANTWECDVCLIRNTSDVDLCVACQNPRTKATVPLKVQPPSTTWICSDCFVHNKDSDASCVCCTASRPGCSFSQTESKESFPGPWTCNSCLFRNAASSEQCEKCNSDKSGTSKNLTGGPEDKSKSFWCCSVCLVKNASTAKQCSACRKPRISSSETSSVSKGTLKFNFEIPPEASAFKFGIDKGEQKPATTESVKGFKFGETSTATSPSNFTFGIPSGNADKKDARGGLSNEMKNSEEVSSKSELSIPTSSQLKLVSSPLVNNLTKPSTEITDRAPTNIDAVNQSQPENQEKKSDDGKLAGKEGSTIGKAISTSEISSKTSGGFMYPVPLSTVSNMTSSAGVSKGNFTFFSSPPGKLTVSPSGQPAASLQTSASAKFTFSTSSTAGSLKRTQESEKPKVPDLSEVAPAGSLFAVKEPSGSSSSKLALDASPKTVVASTSSTAAVSSGTSTTPTFLGNAFPTTSSFGLPLAASQSSGASVFAPPATAAPTPIPTPGVPVSTTPSLTSPFTSTSNTPPAFNVSAPSSSGFSTPASTLAFGVTPNTKATFSTVTTSSCFGAPVVTSSSFLSTTASTSNFCTPSTTTSNTATTAPTLGSSSSATWSFVITTTATSTFGKPVTTTVTASPSFGTVVIANPNFGQTAAASIFRTPTTSAPAPAFGTATTSAPAFGAPVTTAPTFAAPTTTTPRFGVPTTTPPAFGASSSTPSFGTSSTLNFGTPTTTAPSFGNAAAPAFGAPAPAPAFGSTATTTPGFGTPTPAFGMPSAPTPAPTPSFGTSAAAPSFGTPTATTVPSFGTTSTAPIFGNPTSTTTPTIFGAPTTSATGFVVPATTAASGFGSTATFGAFSSNTSMKSSNPQAPFIFGSRVNSNTPNSTFSFNNSQQGSVVGESTSTMIPSFGFGSSNTETNNAAGKPSAVSAFGTFTFTSSSNSNPASTNSVFGANTGGSASSGLGTGAAPSLGAPSTSGNFGSSGFTFTPATQPVAFGSFNPNPAPAPQSFSFTNSQPAVPPTFNPDVGPSFNFTQGATPQFTAVPTTTARHMKKALRRSARRLV